MEKSELRRIVKATPLENFRIQLEFDNGVKKVIDLESHLWGPVFEPIRKKRKMFLKVRVDPELGTICWPNGADLSPDVLYHGGPPPWAKKFLKKTAQ